MTGYFSEGGPKFKPYHVPKPWGEEFVWAHTDDYVGKVLTILPRRRLSLQLHDAKEETILVLKGPVLVWHAEPGTKVHDETTYEVSEPFEVEDGGVIHIAPHTVHRFGSPGEHIVTLLEVSTPHLNDVVRLEDDYARIEDAHPSSAEQYIRRVATRDFS